MADHSDKIPFFDREGYPLHRRFFIRGTGRIPVGQIVEFQNGHNVLSNLSEEILYQKQGEVQRLRIYFATTLPQVVLSLRSSTAFPRNANAFLPTVIIP